MNTNGFKTSKEKSNTLGHQSYTNQNHLEIFYQSIRMVKRQYILARMQRKGTTYSLLVGVQSLWKSVWWFFRRWMEQVFSTHDT